MYCQHCGNQLADGSAFCSQCGKQQGGFAPPPPPMANATPSNFNTQQKSSNKEGDIKKCPSCGVVVQSFTSQCTDCGHEFRNTEANETIERLFNMLQEAKNMDEKFSIITNFPVPNTKEAILEFLAQGISMLKLDYTSPNQKNLKRLAIGIATGGMSEIFRGAKSLSKNEIEKLAPAWRTKCEQVIFKARFSMKGDQKTLEEVEHYAKLLGV